MKHSLLGDDVPPGTSVRPQVRVPTPVFADRLWAWLASPGGFLAFAAGLLAFAVIGNAHLNGWSDVDYWEHLAAIVAFARNPLHPLNPYLAGGGSTHLFTPFHLFWGLIVAATGVRAYAMAPLIAAVNMILFLIGLRLMAATLVGTAAYAVPLGLSMLLLWLAPPWWSGFPSLGLLPLTGSYPYWAALSIALIALGTWSPGGQPWGQVLLGALVALVFLIHPLTGSFLALVLTVRTLTEPSWRVATRVIRLAPIALGLALSLAWPFFPVAGAISAAPAYAQQGIAGDWHEFYSWFPVRLLPASLGALYFVPAFRRGWPDWLGWVLAVCVAIYVVNGLLLRSAFLGRYIIYIALVLQWGVVRWLYQARSAPWARHGVAATIFLATIACTAVVEIRTALEWSPVLWTNQPHTPAGDRKNGDYVRRFERFAPFLSGRDIVMAGMQESWILPAVLGCRVVGVIHGTPFMDDYQARRLAVQRFFDPAVRAQERVSILARYGVTRVVLPQKDVPRLPGLDERTSLLFRDNYYDVRRVESTRVVSAAPR